MSKVLAEFLRAALAALALAGDPLAAADSKSPDAVSLPLSRSGENKLLLRARAPGGRTWMVLDTGAPITCADKENNALFHFAPCLKGMPGSVIMNGKPCGMAVIPQMEFGGVSAKDIPVALVDLSSLTSPRQRETCTAILGLCAMRRMNAVIDFGARTLSVGRKRARSKPPVGWTAIPMRIVDQHLVVPVRINGFATLFVVDTGAPFSIIDTDLARRQRIPLKRNYSFSLKALNYQAKAVQLGLIPCLHIDSQCIGQTLVGVCEVRRILGADLASGGVTGLIGAHTLESLKAVIDCASLRLYIKQP